MSDPRSPRTYLLGVALAVIASTFAFTSARVSAQQPTPPPTQSPDADPDAKIVEGPPKTPAQLRDEAWTMLTDAVTDTRHPEHQIQCLGALGIMGNNTRSLSLMRNAMLDKDVDVRTASALAAGQTKSPNVTTDLRRLLDDKEPQVAFTAALTLWKMHDRSGEDILMAVVDGDRPTAPGMIHGAEHDIHKQLQDPAAIAKYGALQGAGMLLGPFGMGITAFEYLHKNGGDSARVSAIEAISQNKTVPIRKELVAALADKDLGVRAAAAKALSYYHDNALSPEIAKLFADTKQPVRYTAAAAYLISSGVAPGSPREGETTAHPSAKKK